MNVSNPAVVPGILVAIGLCLASLGGCANRPAERADRVERESGTLVARPGYRGDRLGVEVERVGEADADGFQAIDLRLPMAADSVDEVEVVGPGGRPIELGDEPLIRPDADERGVGLRLLLPKSKNLEFRLRLIDVPEN